MILSTKGRYAVMAAVELAQRAESAPIPLAEIAEAQLIPTAYLEQLFGKLRKAGLLESVRGPGGGYRLARAPREVTVAELVRASEESLKMTRCGSAAKGCQDPNLRCHTHDLWKGLEKQIIQYLEGITLEDIMERRREKIRPEIATVVATSS